MQSSNKVQQTFDRVVSKVADREGNYADPAPMFKTIAALWSAWLHIEVKPEDVPIMLDLFKTARLDWRSGGEYTQDNADDKIGYTSLYEIYMESEQVKEEVPISIAWVDYVDYINICKDFEINPLGYNDWLARVGR